MRFPSLFEIVLDPKRVQIEKLEPFLFDIVPYFTPRVKERVAIGSPELANNN